MRRKRLFVILGQGAASTTLAVRGSMTTHYPRMISVNAAPDGDRRRKGRRKASQTADLANNRGLSERVVLVDVSEHGCAVEGNVETFRVGGFATIAISNGQPVQAIVRWTRGARAGLEFLWPIPRDQTAWRDLMDNPIV